MGLSRNTAALSACATCSRAAHRSPLSCHIRVCLPPKTPMRKATSQPEQQEFDAVVADLDMPATAGQETLAEWLEANKPALAQRLIWMRASAASGIKVTQRETGHKSCRSRSSPLICWPR